MQKSDFILTELDLFQYRREALVLRDFFYLRRNRYNI